MLPNFIPDARDPVQSKIVSPYAFSLGCSILSLHHPFCSFVHQEKEKFRKKTPPFRLFFFVLFRNFQIQPPLRLRLPLSISARRLHRCCGVGAKVINPRPKPLFRLFVFSPFLFLCAILNFQYLTQISGRPRAKACQEGSQK